MRAAVAGSISTRRSRTTALPSSSQACSVTTPGAVAPRDHDALGPGRQGDSGLARRSSEPADGERQVGRGPGAAGEAVTGPVASSRSAWTPARPRAAQHAAEVDLVDRRRGERDLLEAGRRELAVLADQLEGDPHLAVAGVGQGEGRGRRPSSRCRRRTTSRRARPATGSHSRTGRSRPTGSTTSTTCDASRPRETLTRSARASRLGATSERSKEVERPPGTRDAAQRGDVDETAAVPDGDVGDGRAPVGVDEGEGRGVLGGRADAGEPALGCRLVAAGGRPGAGARRDEAGCELAAAVDDDVLPLGARRDAVRQGLRCRPRVRRAASARPSRARWCPAGSRRRRAGGRGRPRSTRSSGASVGGVGGRRLLGRSHEGERGDGQQRDERRRGASPARVGGARSRRPAAGRLPGRGGAGLSHRGPPPVGAAGRSGAASTSATRIARPCTTSSTVRHHELRALERRRVERAVDAPGAGRAVLGTGLLEPGGRVEERRDRARRRAR